MKLRRITALLALFSLIICVMFSFHAPVLHADTTPSPTQTQDNSPSNVVWPQPCKDKGISGSDCVNFLANTVVTLKGQEETLSSQIAIMDSQIQLTQARIYATQQKINDLTLDIDTTNKKISGIQSSLDGLTKVLLNRVVTTYEIGTIQPLHILLTAGTAGDFLSRLNYLKIAQAHDKRLMYDTVQAKNDYQNQKSIYEDKKKQIEALKVQLEGYTTQLNQEKVGKQQLLAETQGSESTYKQLLEEAKARLAALAGFANARVGTGGGVIPHKDLSDGWGKYYNQRDANWGNNYIGYSNYQVWSVGCLLTSYAMVVNHFGGSITPGDVASNADNFISADFKRPGPSANGHGVNYVADPTVASLKSEVQAGNPVIAGLSVNGGPASTHYSDHWVVLRGVDSDGTFLINDPWYDGAMSTRLSDHYSGWTIIEARIYH